MGYTILKDKDVTTRKDHQCFGCLLTIPKGTITRYRFSVHDNLYDGGGYYLCQSCLDIEEEIPNDYFVDEGIPEGFITEYERESKR